MTGALRGRASFEAQDKRWTLVVDFNTLVAIEEELGVTPQEIGEKVAASAKVVRTVFRLALEETHGAMTDREAGRLISAIGQQEASRLLGEAVTSAFPEAEVGPRPRTRRRAKPS